MEWNGKKNEMENNGENSTPLTSVPVDCLMATDCNAAARAKMVSTVVGYKYLMDANHQIFWFAGKRNSV